jgi:hypothetical protein
MMSEDHEYNESEDEAIVTAAKAGGTADEVLMGMLRDLRKVKKIRRASICGISRSFAWDHRNIHSQEELITPME